jgi:hypothetical protein
MGFEPTISAVRGRCPKPLDDRSNRKKKIPQGSLEFALLNTEEQRNGGFLYTDAKGSFPLKDPQFLRSSVLRPPPKT